MVRGAELHALPFWKGRKEHHVVTAEVQDNAFLDVTL
jgi:hypothetical protein